MKGSGGSHYRKERFYLDSRYYFRWEMIKIIRLEILIVLYIAKINGNNLYFCSRTSHEVRGLKYFKTPLAHTQGTVAPHTRCMGGVLVCQ